RGGAAARQGAARQRRFFWRDGTAEQAATPSRRGGAWVLPGAGIECCGFSPLSARLSARQGRDRPDRRGANSREQGAGARLATKATAPRLRERGEVRGLFAEAGAGLEGAGYARALWLSDA